MTAASAAFDPMVELEAMEGKGLVRLVQVRVRVLQVTQRGKAILIIYPP